MNERTNGHSATAQTVTVRHSRRPLPPRLVALSQHPPRFQAQPIQVCDRSHQSRWTTLALWTLWLLPWWLLLASWLGGRS